MLNHKRCGNKWSINELLNLQREYELLEWNIQMISLKHERSVESILYKLEEEGFISSWSEARGFKASNYKKKIENVLNHNKVNEDDEDDEYDEDEEYDEDDEDDEDYIYEEDEEELEEERKNDENDENEDEDDDDDEKDNENNKKINALDKLSERVCNLETSLIDIGLMVKQMFNKQMNNKQMFNKQMNNNLV